MKFMRKIAGAAVAATLALGASSAASAATGSALISSTVVVWYGIGFAALKSAFAYLLFALPLPHDPYFQGGSATMVA